MIERKRRNDFVRKREFDMLRKVRREGLSPEQLAALGGSSRIDDSEARITDSAGAPGRRGVKAKIDEIEQQMVGDGFGYAGSQQRTPEFYNAPTSRPSLPATLGRRGRSAARRWRGRGAPGPTACRRCRRSQRSRARRRWPRRRRW